MRKSNRHPLPHSRLFAEVNPDRLACPDIVSALMFMRFKEEGVVDISVGLLLMNEIHPFGMRVKSASRKLKS